LKQLPVLTSVKKNCKYVSSELWIFSNSIFVLFLIYSNLWLGEQIKSKHVYQEKFNSWNKTMCSIRKLPIFPIFLI
jgi:hypothetical protein